MTQPAMSEYDGEEGYSTPTTTTLSSEVIGSAGGSGSLRLSSRDRHLQSSGFISCFDCPTNRSFSIGTRSPPSSSKLNGSERSERRPKLPAIWVHGQKDRVHRTTSCNGYSALPSQNLQIAKENVQRETIRRDPDTMYAEVPPKPPPFSMPSNDTRIPPVSTKVQYDCGTPPIPRPSPPQTSPSSFGNSLLGHSQSAHEFDAPNRLRPDDQIRYWRALAVSSRADAASQRARAHALVGELTRIRCDLNMAELEIGLLRKRLAAAEAELRCHYRLGLVPSSKDQVWTENWSSR
ncbi:Rho GTPase-activating protein 22 [Fasciola gigantica]|uniref:Rho GTPase-activating protein 22 n=1 Tax=Fasciola gigantica TaxID=46835 RepID=A0A504Y5C4_FASGI|nr:Rho GTPase-activating protein 22 [Fasciola gigantica]